MKLSVKLPVSFAILVILFIGYGTVGIFQLKAVYKSTNELAVNWLPSIKEIGNISRDFADFRRFELNYLTAVTDEIRYQNEQLIVGTMEKVKQSQARYEKLISSDEERRIYESFVDYAKQYYVLHDKIMALLKQDKKEEALITSSTEVPKVLGPALEALKKGVAINDKSSADEAAAGQATYEQARLFAIVLLSVAALLGIALGVYIPRSILPALIKGRDFASKLAVGDLTGSLDINNKDELGELAASLRSVADAEKDVAAMASRMSQGDLTLDIKPRSGADVLLQSLAALLEADKRVAQAAQKMANGDLRVTIAPRSEGDALMQALVALLEADRAVAGLAEKLAAGELRLKVQARSENDGLMHSLRDMVAKLTEIVTEVQSGAENMASGSQELSASSQSLSQGASEQASAVEECSSSMEEMSSAINQNADNARQTESLARKAAQDARESGAAMNQTVAAMREIASRISVIEEIARQTDLLALNAAIEAARAGEQGPGIRRGGLRGPQARRTQPGRGRGNQYPVRLQSRRGRTGRYPARQARARHPQDLRTGPGNRRLLGRAEFRRRPGQPGPAAARPGGATKRLLVRGTGLHRRGTLLPGRTAPGHGRLFPGRGRHQRLQGPRIGPGAGQKGRRQDGQAQGGAQGRPAHAHCRSRRKRAR